MIVPAHKFYPQINPNDLQANRDNIVNALDLSTEKDAIVKEYAITGKYPAKLFKFSPPYLTENDVYNLKLYYTDENGRKLYTAYVRQLTVRVKNKKFVLRDFKVKITDTFFYISPSLFTRY